MTPTEATFRETAAEPLQAKPGENGLPPYHVFEKFGEHFVYDLSSARFFHIDEPAYRLLGLCLERPLEDAVAQLIHHQAFPAEQIHEVAGEIELLAQHGLFEVPDYTLDDAEIERQLDLRYSAPWTKLELALAETCNLACTYCYCSTWRDMPRQGLMSREVAKTAIDWLFKASRDRKEIGLTLFGGEPLLNKPVFKFVMDYSDALAKKHGKIIRYSMTTNGTLLDDMVIHYIKKHNFGLMVSLDGPPEIHNAQRPSPDGRGSFDAAAAGIKRLMKRRKRLTVRCTLTNAKTRIMDLIRFFEDFGFTRIDLAFARTPLNPSPSDCALSDLLDYERQEEQQVLPWVIAQAEAGRMPTYMPYQRFFCRDESQHDSGRGALLFKCGACRGTTTVGVDGSLYPCHRYVGMESFVLGRISEGPNTQRSKAFWRRHQQVMRNRCSRCWARLLCKQPCPWGASGSEGGFRESQKDECDFTKRFFTRAAWLQWHLQTKHADLYRTIVGSGMETDHGTIGND